MTDNGHYLAAGGTKGVTLWDLRNGRLLDCLSDREILFYGTQNGYLVCWKQVTKDGKDFEEIQSVQIQNPGEVTSIDYNSASNRLAVCNQNGSVMMFAIESSMVPLGLMTINNYLPTSIVFGLMSESNAAKDLLVFGLTGEIQERLQIEKTLNVSGMMSDSLALNASQYSIIILPISSGHAIISATKDTACIDDPAEGAALYQLHDGAWPWQITFAEDGKVIVSGSNHGVVYLYDRRTGTKIVDLEVDCQDWVQTLMPCVIATRSRELEGDAKVFIWMKGIETSQMPPRVLTVKHLALLFMVMATTGFVYQNLLLAHGVIKEMIARKYL
ncbi:WD40-repeat-containing domain protein [Armillaria mellea]|nr:WD40-repeat-containing domain protein [Armillaria mellea]